MMQFDRKMYIFLFYQIADGLLFAVNSLLFLIVTIKRSSKLKLKQTMSLNCSNFVVIYG